MFKLLWIDAPKWVFAGVYVALGLVTRGRLRRVAGHDRLARRGRLGARRPALRARGDRVRKRRPNPWPKVFGYHEVFHALVIVAAALQYAVIAFVVSASRLTRTIGPVLANPASRHVPCRPRRASVSKWTEHASTRAHPRQGAFVARRVARVTRSPPVAQQVHVELELLARRRNGEHLVVQLLEGSAGTKQAQSRADTRDVSVNRNVGQAVGEQQDAGRRLAAHARQSAQVVAARPLAAPSRIHSSDRRPVASLRGALAHRAVGAPRGVRDRRQDRLDTGRLDLGDAAWADRLLHLGHRRRKHGLVVDRLAWLRESARADAETPRRGCGRWCSVRALSGSTHLVAAHGAPCAVRHRSRAGGRGCAARVPEWVASTRTPSGERRERVCLDMD